MSGGDIAALIAAAAFVVLVLVLAVLLVKAGRTLDAATRAINDMSNRGTPLLDNVTITVDGVNTALTQVQKSLDGVNLQLDRLDTITGHAQTVTANVANLSTIVTAATSNPLVKVAAFSYGVRKAALARRRADEEKQVRAELKGRRRAARRGH